MRLVTKEEEHAQEREKARNVVSFLHRNLHLIEPDPSLNFHQRIIPSLLLATHTDSIHSLQLRSFCDLLLPVTTA